MLTRMFALATVALGGAILAKKFAQSRHGAPGTRRVTEEIDVSLPVRSVYDQWTQFEEFPRFMQSVHEVRQLDDSHLHWEADVFGRRIEWDAEITEQTPDRKIAWRSTSGRRNDGVVTFRSLSPTQTRVTLELSCEPEGAVEHIGEAMGAVRSELRDNLQRFKEQLEQRGQETGAWRGAINGNSENHRPL